MKQFGCLPRSERRAVTLVELLVVAAVSAVVLAILLVTFDHTQRLAQREVTRNRQRQDALLTLERVSAVVTSAVPLASLDADAAVEEIFEPHHLRVASWHGADAERVWVHDIAGAAEADRATPLISRLSLDGRSVSEEPREHELTTGVGFRYAAVARAGEEIAWRPSAAAFPALIQVTVTTSAREGEEKPFVVSTVLATGVGGIL